MSELFFFILGIVNSIFLIFTFLIRKDRFNLLQRLGRFYFILALPALYGIFLVLHESKDMRYIIFLLIFLVFLIVEWLYDYKLKISFRENWIRNWKLSLPYLGFYYAMNYGFVVMPWKTNFTWGVVMLCLFVIQIVTNIRSHPRTST